MKETFSVCPVCLRPLQAERIVREGKTCLERTCPEHGFFSAPVWAGDYAAWGAPHPPVSPVNPAHTAARGCPLDCGLCEAHRQRTCCVLLEVTSRCSLGCPVCFASAGQGRGTDMPMADIRACLAGMLSMGGPFNIQLSGGEPTERDDLPEIIRMGKGMGYPFFQLNTNGLRLAAEPGYAQTLFDAGLDCVFLQFDGMTDKPYEILRGRPLLSQKLSAIERCAAAGLGVVLVPVLAAGVNTHEIGAILDFALAHMPAVRGVHFQPMSRFGRCGVTAEHYTLPQLAADIEAQTDGRMRAADFAPGNAEDAHCSFSGNFMRMADGSLQRWGRGCGCGSQKGCCQSEEDTARAEGASARSRRFVARRWSAARPVRKAPEPDALDDFLQRVETQTLAVSAMGFMDAWTLDLERLRQCYIHVARLRPDGQTELIPFCAYNLTAEDGTALYRGQ